MSIGFARRLLAAPLRAPNKSYYTVYVDQMVNDQAKQTYTVYIPVGAEGHEADTYMELYKAAQKENSSKTWMYWRLRDGKIVRRVPKTSKNVMTYQDFRGAIF